MSFKKFLCLFVVLGLFAVSLASPGPDTPGVDSPSSSSEVERSFEFNFGSDQVKVKVHLKSADFESEISHELIAAGSGAEFRVEFQQKAGQTENQLRLRLRLFELIEYIPDATPGYQNEPVSR